jgi:hypothetical protein
MAQYENKEEYNKAMYGERAKPKWYHSEDLPHKGNEKNIIDLINHISEYNYKKNLEERYGKGGGQGLFYQPTSVMDSPDDYAKGILDEDMRRKLINERNALYPVEESLTGYLIRNLLEGIGLDFEKGRFGQKKNVKK